MSLSPKTKKRLKWGCGIVLASVFALWLILMTGSALHWWGMYRQVQAGRAYFDTLTPADAQTWIEKTQTLLAQNKEASFWSGKEVPGELRSLKVASLLFIRDKKHADTEGICYIWNQHIWHTGLIVRHDKPSGVWTVEALYDTDHRKTLWPPPVAPSPAKRPLSAEGALHNSLGQRPRHGMQKMPGLKARPIFAARFT